jgi:hypothetical protein
MFATASVPVAGAQHKVTAVLTSATSFEKAPSARTLKARIADSARDRPGHHPRMAASRLASSVRVFDDLLTAGGGEA